MRLRFHRGALVVGFALVVGIVVLAGCLGGIGGDSTAEEVTDQLQTEYDDVDGLEATVEVERNDSQLVNSSTAKIWIGEDDRIRQDVVDADGPSEGVTILTDEETLSYSAETGVYATYDYRLDILDVHSYDHERIVENLDAYDAEYRGTEEIDGRSVSHLVYTVPDGEEGSIPEIEFYTYSIGGEFDVEMATPERVELWIDEEEAYPLRHEITLEENRSEVTVEYTDVRFGPVDESVFEYEPPDDAEEFEEARGAIRPFDSEAAAAAYAGFSADLPETVDDRELAHVEVKELEEGRSIVGWYETGSADHEEIDRNESVNVEVTTDGFREDLDGEKRELNGVEVVVDDVIGLACDERYYAIDGNESEAQLLEFAEAIEC